MIFDGKKVVVVRTDKLGDIILSLPFSKLIKLRLGKKSRIFYIVREGFEVLFEGNPYVEGVFGAEIRGERGELTPRGFFLLFMELLRLKPDYSFVLFPRFSVALLLRLVSAVVGRGEVIGTSRRPYSFLFTKRVNLSRRRSEMHEAYYNLLLLSPFFDVENYVRESELFGELRPEVFVNSGFEVPFSGYVVFHPFSGGSAPNKDLDFWIEVARFMRSKVVWIGKTKSAGDLHLGFSLVNRTDLRELCGVIRRSRGVFSPASGPIHLASALGKKTAGIYSSREVKRWRPLGDSVIFRLENLPSPHKIASELEEFFKI